MVYSEEMRRDYFIEMDTNLKQLQIALDKLGKNKDDEGFKKLISRLCHTIEGNSLFMKEYEVAYIATKLSHSVDLNEINYALDFLSALINAIKRLKSGGPVKGGVKVGKSKS